jgi:hypothetical protein
MNALKNTLVATLLATLATHAFGFVAEIPVRDFSKKLPTDDVIVIETQGNTGDERQWFNSIDSNFQIWMIENSIKVLRKTPNLPGIEPGFAAFTALENLHDLKNDETHKSYDMRIMFDEDLLWVEVWPSNKMWLPVRNTLMFFGPDKKTYDFYLKNGLDGVKYANENELKSYIRKNYAEKADPDFNHLLNYRAAVRAAMRYVGAESD